MKHLLFSDSEINTGRQIGVDMAKMFAIFFMVIIHTFEFGEADVTTGLGYFFDSIAGAQFGAPVFMLCMGIGLTFSRKSDAATMAKRGAMLFVAGYVIDVLRALPLFILWRITCEADYLPEAVHILTDVDILQFAGLSFLLIALFKRLHLSYGWLALVAVLMSIAGNFVRQLDLGSFWLNLLVSPFVGVKTELVQTDFPLLNWFGFVIAGYYMGRLLRRCTDTDRLCLILLPVSAVLYGAYATYAIPRGIGMLGTESSDFYHMTSFDFIICVLAAVAAMSACHFIAKLLTDNLMQAVTRICNDLTKIYVAQWVIIMWVVGGFMTNWMGWILPIGWQFVMGIGILLLSIGWARLKPLSKLKM